MTMIVFSVKARRKALLLFGVLGLFIFITGFKPPTHMHTGNEVLKDIGVVNKVILNEKSYEIPKEIYDAIRQNPTYYRAGTIGPDGFPDLIVGQGNIHPDTRCNNGKDACGWEPGIGFTYEWLGWIFDRANQYYLETKDSNPDEAARVLAFSMGYLTHADGDLWSHTLANHHAKGIFPSVAEMAADQEKAKIALRHIISETYIANRAPPESGQKTINAPLAFIRKTFIRSKEPSSDSELCPSNPQIVPTALLTKTHYDQFLQLRQKLCKFRGALDTDVGWEEIGECLIGACLWDEAAQGVIHSYVTSWIEDIDSGLTSWPQELGLNVSRELFSNNSFEEAEKVANEFILLHLMSMLGAPDFVGGGIYNLQQTLEVISGFIDNIAKPWAAPIEYVKKRILDALFWEITGMTLTEFKDYYKNPDNWIDNTEKIGFDSDTSLKINKEMGISSASTSYVTDERFPVFKNTITLGKLILLPPSILDRYLFDMHVGKLYTGTRLDNVVNTESTSNLMISGTLSDEMKKNAMLGYDRSIDGNHAWMKKSPDLEQPGGPAIILGEGMPLWSDCLARDRVFYKLFKNSASLGFEKYSDHCSVLADPLPPVSIIIKYNDLPVNYVRSTRCGLRLIVDLINHQNNPQTYSFYYRIISRDETIFHRVYHRGYSEAIPPLGKKSEIVDILGCLRDGEYRVEIYLYKKMWGFPGHSQNWEIPTSEPYFSIPINNPTRVNITVAGECTLTELGLCESGEIAPSSQSCPRVTNYCINTTIDWEFHPLLDADADGIIDYGPDRDNSPDNCPVVPNSNQQDTNKDGIGDACTLITDVLNKWEHLEWMDFIERAQGVIELLIKFGLLDPPKVSDSFCMICPPASRESLPLVKSLLTEWKQGVMNERDILNHLSGVLGGPKQTALNIDILDAGISIRSKSLNYVVTSRGGGMLAVEIPKTLMNLAKGSVKRSYSVSIDKKAVSVETLIGKYDVTLLINIPQGKHDIEIKGQ